MCELSKRDIPSREPDFTWDRYDFYIEEMVEVRRNMYNDNIQSISRILVRQMDNALMVEIEGYFHELRDEIQDLYRDFIDNEINKILLGAQ